MDRETKTAFASVNGRLDKIDEQLLRAGKLISALAEGQVRHDAAIARLIEGQLLLTDRVDKLTDRVDKLAQNVDKLAERVDGFTAAVLRGFTEGAGRDQVIERRVDAMEKRIDALERGQP